MSKVLNRFMHDERTIKPCFAWAMVFLSATFWSYDLAIRLYPSVVVPNLMEAWAIDKASLGVLSSSFYLGYVLLSLMVGPLLDRFSPKWLVTISALAVGVSSCLFGYSDWLMTGSIARFVVGAASAFAFVGALKFSANWLSPRQFGFATGMISLIGMSSATISQNLLSHLNTQYPWDSLSIVLGLIGIALAAIFALFLRDPVSQEIPQATPELKKSTMQWDELVLEVKNLFINQGFLVNGIIGCLTFLPILGFSELWGVYYLEQVFGLSPIQAAKYSSMVYLGWALGCPFFGWLNDRIDAWHRLMFWGNALALVAILLVMLGCVSIAWVGPLLFIFGFTASVHVLVFVSAKQLVPLKRSGTALAFTNVFIMLGGLVFPPLIGWLMDNITRVCMHFNIAMQPHLAFHIGISVIPLGLFVTLILVRAMPQMKQPSVMFWDKVSSPATDSAN